MHARVSTYQGPSGLSDPEIEEITNESYGPLKVACEQEVLAAFPGRALIVRPGYIVGPHDPTDRFTYWVRRAGAGGEMLAPGPDDGALQVVDVRDLGAFALEQLERGTSDVFGVVGPPEPLTWAGFLPLVCEAARAGTSPTWVDRPFLVSQLGDDLDEAFPLRDYPYQSLHQYDARKAMAAGLMHRPLEETIADTLAWDGGSGPLKAGITVEREQELLKGWRASATS